MQNFRLLHTSDWHLGGVLHEQSREHEQQAFLDWLLGLLQEEQIQALLIAGDVFDRPNPSARTQSIFFNFIAAAKARLPGLQTVILAGDHDSATRLEASQALLAALGVRVLGRLSGMDGKANLDHCLITLNGADGNPAAHLSGVSYLHPRELGILGVDESASRKLVQSISSVYGRLCEEALGRAGDERASLAAGHLYLAGSRVSETSERKIQNRYLAAVPVDLFSPLLSYVALGHLHLGQSLADNVHYSGSPLPLSFADSEQAQRVLIAEFEGPRMVETRAVPVPRPVRLLRVPGDGPQALEQVFEAIHQLEALDGRDPSSPERPYLEIRVRLAGARPDLGEEIRRELVDRWPRLLKISLEQERRQDACDQPDRPHRWLEELEPEQIFRHCYRRKHSSPFAILNEPSDLLMNAFRLLCEQEKGEGQ